MHVLAEIEASALWHDGSSVNTLKQHDSLYSYALLLLSMQEKLQNKEKKEADEKKFKFAKVDGRTEQVEPFWAHVLHYCPHLCRPSCLLKPAEATEQAYNAEIF